MAAKGIKLKHLARELGLTSRQLIDRCRAEGVPVQNSITKLPPHLELIVRSWFTGTLARQNSAINASNPCGIDPPGPVDK